MKILKIIFLLVILQIPFDLSAQNSPEDSLAFKQRERELIDSLKIKKDDYKLLESLAILYRENAEIDKSTEIFLKIKDLFNFPKTYMRIALNYYFKEDINKSIEYINKGLEKSQSDSMIFFAAFLYHFMDSNEKALEYLERVIFKDDIYFEPLLLYCDIKFHMYDTTNFYSTILRMEKLDNTNSELYKSYARYYRLIEDYENALTSINKAISLNSDDDYYFLLRGIILYELKKYELALKDFLSKYEGDDYLILKNLYLGRIYSRLDSLEKSMEYYLTFEEIMDDIFEIDDFYNVGVYYIEKADYVKASYYYEKCLKLDSTHANTLNDLALIYWYTKNFDLAESYFQKSIKTEPNEKIVLQNYAMFLASQKRVSDVLVILDKLIEIDPENIKEYEDAKKMIKNEGIIEF